MMDTYFDFTARSLRNLGVPPGEVDDAVQQVFIIAWKKIDAIELHAERSFLFQTSVRIASRALRTRFRRRESDNAALSELAHRGPGPEELIDGQRARVLVDRVLHHMPLELRAVFVLFEVEQLATSEISDVLGIPQGTVKSRLRRAREEFSAQVRRLRSHPRNTLGGS